MGDPLMKEDRPLDGLTTPDTYFASSARATSERIRELSELALADPILGIVFEAVGGYALVIDQHRQIIAANDELLQMLGAKRDASLLGLRPGEAFHCINAARGPGGCGTSLQCRHCGAVAAILAAQVERGLNEIKVEGLDGRALTQALTHYFLTLATIALNESSDVRLIGTLSGHGVPHRGPWRR